GRPWESPSFTKGRKSRRAGPPGCGGVEGGGVAERLEQECFEAGELRGGGELDGARARQVDVEGADDPGRPPGRDEGAAREVGRLADVVGDEEAGPLVPGRERQRELLHLAAREAVVRAERVVQQERRAVLDDRT